MNAIPSIDMLEAAAYALVGERCRNSYLHDLRGELQSLQSAVELLARAAVKPGENSALAEKAATLARRTVQNHEKSLAQLLNHLAPVKESAQTVNLGELIAEALRFMRNEAACKSVTFHLQPVTEIVVVTQPHKLRLLLVGLWCGLIDAAPPGAAVDVRVERRIQEVMIEFRSTIPCPAIQNPEELWHSVGIMSSSFELLLALTQQWVSVNGGRLEPPMDSHLPKALRIYYPLASSASGAAQAAR